MRCSDIVMSAMSYHPSHSKGRVARGYWDFVAGWQSEKGDLHHLGGQWYTLELASRFRFRSVRRILKKGLPLAARRQRQDGGFQADYPAGSACEVVLAYSRHAMLKELCRTLPHDAVPLIASSRRALAVKTRREALGASRRDLATLADELVAGIVGRQRSDGSWDGLVVATVGAVHDLLDCGLSPQEKRVRKACQWLCGSRSAWTGRFSPGPLALGWTGCSMLTKSRRRSRGRRPDTPNTAGAQAARSAWTSCQHTRRRLLCLPCADAASWTLPKSEEDLDT